MPSIVRKFILIASTLFILVFFVSGCALLDGTPGRGAVLEKWQTENQTIKIRVTCYEETGAYLNGAYYVFESAASGSNGWHEILTFRHDDQPKIPTNQVRLLNDRVAYLFMGWVYAVTTDGGTSWSVWDARRDLQNGQCCNYQSIRDVQLTIDGAGTLILNPIPQQSGEVPQLQTQDYGRHWSCVE